MTNIEESQGAAISHTNNDFVWIDWPSEGWLAGKWDWTHTIGCAFAFFLYIIPGLIFLPAKQAARSKYLAKLEETKAARGVAFQRTGCVWLASVLHLGGHPLLPYRERVVLGLKRGSIVFYDYRLNLLHSVPLEQVRGNWDTRHVTSTSFGTAYVPQGSSFGTTSSTQHIDMHPDTLRFSMPVNGKQITAEFDCRPNVDPLDFIQSFNKLIAS